MLSGHIVFSVQRSTPIEFGSVELNCQIRNAEILIYLPLEEEVATHIENGAQERCWERDELLQTFAGIPSRTDTGSKTGLLLSLAQLIIEHT